MVRLVDSGDSLDAKGDLYVHQDANWNVIALTDLGGRVVERYIYTPYGQVTVHQETAYGDYDGDKDVDSTDRAAAEVGGACRGSNPTGACRILDLDFDNDIDDDDLTDFDNLPQGLARHPARSASGVHQPFAHQGLLHEPELGTYQNRARQYDPAKKRFLQRDPFLLSVGYIRANNHYQDGLNPFTYVRGNPVTRLDASGLVCGDAGTDWLVPDHTRCYVDISGACAVHDVCYGICGVNKDDCDQEFHDNINAICSEISWLLPWCVCDCYAMADIYQFAVSTFGDEAFDNAQSDCPDEGVQSVVGG